MSRAKLLLVGVVAALSVVGMSASSASAVNYEWKVNGAALPSGSSKVILGSAVGNIDLDGRIGATGTLLLSNKLTVTGGKIFGGKPGTDEGKFTFESVKVDKPAKCAIKGGLNVLTVNLKSEIVQSAVGKAGTGKVQIVFAPKTGTIFTEFELANNGAEVCPISSNQGLAVEGEVLAEPATGEATTQTLGFEPTNTEYENSKGEFKKAGLIFASFPAKLTGTTNAILDPNEKFGVF